MNSNLDSNKNVYVWSLYLSLSLPNFKLSNASGKWRKSVLFHYNKNKLVFLYYFNWKHISLLFSNNRGFIRQAETYQTEKKSLFCFSLINGPSSIILIVSHGLSTNTKAIWDDMPPLLQKFNSIKGWQRAEAKFKVQYMS